MIDNNKFGALAVGVLILLVSWLGLLPTADLARGDLSDPGILWPDQSPIHITSDSDLGNYSDSGSGTPADPFIFENRCIDMTMADGHGFHIENTQSYFIIRNSWIKGNGTTSYDGIRFSNVENGTVENCRVNGTKNGTHIEYSSYVTIRYTNITDNSQHGILIKESDNNLIEGNNITNNSQGMYMDFSDHNTVYDNYFYGNNHGMFLGKGNDYNDIIDNRLLNGSYGLFAGIPGETGSKNNQIIENIICNNSNNGINIIGDSKNNEIGLNYIYNNSIGMYLSDPNIVHNNTIDNNSDDGIQLSGSNGNIIEYNTITNNTDDGIWIRGSKHNIIYKNTIDNNDDGIYGSPSGGMDPINNSIIDNIFSDNKNGIYFWNDYSDNTIKDNRFVDNSDKNIWMRDSSSGNHIENNTIVNGSYGIYLQESDGCQLIDNKINGTAVHGIQLYLTNDTTISGNEIWNVDGANHRAIYIRGLSANNLLKANQIHDNEMGIVIRDGTSGFPQYNTITGNKIYDNIESGIYHEASKLNTIHDNDIYNNGNDGIYLVDSNETEITANRVYGHTSGRGIYLIRSHWNDRIDSNYIQDNIRGIYFDGSTNNTMAGNTFQNNSNGIRFWDDSNGPSENNTVRANDFLDNGYGLYAYKSPNNLIYLNNFINSSDDNARDNDAENFYNGSQFGNYWDDYTGSDTDGDGIGEDSYNVPGASSVDHYPLAELYEDNIYWVEEAGAGEGKIEGQPAGNLSHVIDNYVLDNCTVNVKAGTYDSAVENYPLDVDDDNVTIKALDGPDNTYLLGSGSQDCFYITASDVAIDNFTMDNFQTAILVGSFGDPALYNVSVSNNRIANSSQNGLKAYTSVNIVVANNEYYNNSCKEIYLNGAINAFIRDNTFLQSDTDYNIRLTDSRLSTIEDNTLTDCKGVYLENSPNNTITGNTLSTVSYGFQLGPGSNNNTLASNEIDDVVLWAIELEESSNNSVADSIVSGCSYGIYLHSESRDNLISGSSITSAANYGIRAESGRNTIVHNDISGTVNSHGIFVKKEGNEIGHNTIYSHNHGIRLYHTENTTAHNNTVHSIEREGIWLEAGHNNTVKDNVVEDSENGIKLEGSDYNIISDNRADSNSLYGISLSSSQRNNLLGNTVRWNSKHGIYLGLSDNTTLEYNTLDGNLEYGIELEGCRDALVTDNQFSSCGQAAVSIKQSVNVTASGNEMDGGGFSITGQMEGFLSQWNTHSIDTTNTVGGGPVIYMVDTVGAAVPESAGQVILVNCSRIDVKNLELSGLYKAVSGAFSDNCTIADNMLEGNGYGIYFNRFEDGTIVNNTIANSSGIGITGGGHSEVYHNNFINNTEHTTDIPDESWDDGYPSGGNYWDDYTGVDEFSGPDQDIPGRDGIGDEPYRFYAKDNYPLMQTWPMDDSPPVISSLSVNNITPDSASVRWQTDDLCDSRVNYSGDPDMTTGESAYEEALVTEHIVNITGLTPDTTYYFELYSVNTVGDMAWDNNDSSYYSFKTQPAPTPEITDLTTGTPSTGDPFTFTANVTDEVSINRVYVSWSYGSGDENTKQMKMSGGNWSKSINVRNDATLLNYSIKVRYWDEFFETSMYVSTENRSVQVVDNDEPHIDFYPADMNVEAGKSVGFYAGSSYDNIGIVNYTWEIEELGVFLYGAPQEYTFEDLGNYTLTLTIRDTAGNTNTSSGYLNVIDLEDPVAHAGPDREVVVGTEVQFNGSGSTDNIGIVGYEWSIVYDIDPMATLSGAMPTFTFDMAEVYRVTLTVTDVSGNDDTDVMNVTVVESGPVAHAGEDMEVEAGETFELNASGSEGMIYEYNWTIYYGDETINLPGMIKYATLEEPGEYTATLTVTGPGGTDTDEITITVVEPGTGDGGFDIEIGPVTYSGGGVISGAPVHAEGEGMEMDTQTDYQGMISLENVSAGVVTVSVEVDGETYTFDVTVNPDGSVDYDLPDIPVPDDGETVEVTLGPIKDKDGQPIHGAKVTIEFDGGTYEGTTDEYGMAIIEDVPADAVGKDITVIVSKDGYEDSSYTTTLNNDGSPDEGPSPMEEKEDKEKEQGDAMPYLVLAVIVIAVIIGLVLISRRKGGKEKSEEPLPVGKGGEEILPTEEEMGEEALPEGEGGEEILPTEEEMGEGPLPEGEGVEEILPSEDLDEGAVEDTEGQEELPVEEEGLLEDERREEGVEEDILPEEEVEEEMLPEEERKEVTIGEEGKEPFDEEVAGEGSYEGLEEGEEARHDELEGLFK